MSYRARLYIPIDDTPEELRKRLKLDTAMGAFYVNDPTDAQLQYLLDRGLITQSAADDVRIFREDPSADSPEGKPDEGQRHGVLRPDA